MKLYLSITTTTMKAGREIPVWEGNPSELPARFLKRALELTGMNIEDTENISVCNERHGPFAFNFEDVLKKLRAGNNIVLGPENGPDKLAVLTLDWWEEHFLDEWEKNYPLKNYPLTDEWRGDLPVIDWSGA